MEIRKTFKYRLYPTKAQVEALDLILWRCRDLYNAGLQERREAWRLAHKSLSFYEQSRELPALKAACPEYKAVPSQVLQDTLRRLDKAFAAFFRRMKAGQTPGFPRYQRRTRYQSFTYPSAQSWRRDDDRLVLAGVGAVKIRFHRPIEGTIKTVTIRRDGDQWYVSFSCVLDIAPLPPCDQAVGIDLGLLHFATLSTGATIANPRYLRRALAKLATAQQQLARCRRGSHRRHRAKAAVTRLHRQVRHQRSDFLHQQSRRLVNEYGTIVLEDLAIANLSHRPAPKVDADATAATGEPVYTPNGAAAKSGLNKSILDAGWGQFAQLCAVKAAWAGRQVLFVDPKFTSQLCSQCGAIHKKTLAERWHSCACGCELDRDHNAALNILRRGTRLRESSLQGGSSVEAPGFNWGSFTNPHLRFSCTPSNVE